MTTAACFVEHEVVPDVVETAPDHMLEASLIFKIWVIASIVSHIFLFIKRNSSITRLLSARSN